VEHLLSYRCDPFEYSFNSFHSLSILISLDCISETVPSQVLLALEISILTSKQCGKYNNKLHSRIFKSRPNIHSQNQRRGGKLIITLDKHCS